MSKPFWETKSLKEMTEIEWESLCDGCAQCCLQKLEFEDTGEVEYTRLACRLLDTETGHCRNYENRLSLVSDCLKINPEDIDEFKWLPASCAYRRLSEGKTLPEWHPLITGDRNSVSAAGYSVKGRVIPEDWVSPDDWEEHIIHWVKL